MRRLSQSTRTRRESDAAAELHRHAPRASQEAGRELRCYIQKCAPSSIAVRISARSTPDSGHAAAVYGAVESTGCPSSREQLHVVPFRESASPRTRQVVVDGISRFLGTRTAKRRTSSETAIHKTGIPRWLHLELLLNQNPVGSNPGSYPPDRHNRPLRLEAFELINVMVQGISRMNVSYEHRPRASAAGIDRAARNILPLRERRALRVDRPGCRSRSGTAAGKRCGRRPRMLCSPCDNPVPAIRGGSQRSSPSGASPPRRCDNPHPDRRRLDLALCICGRAPVDSTEEPRGCSG